MKEYNETPFTTIRIKHADKIESSDEFERKVAIQIAESFDNAVMKEIFKIAKEQGYTDLFLINKEFVTEALKNEIKRRKEDETIKN